MLIKTPQKFCLKKEVIILFNILINLLIIIFINIINLLFLLNALKKYLILYICRLHILVFKRYIKKLLHYFIFINSLKQYKFIYNIV